MKNNLIYYLKNTVKNYPEKTAFVDSEREMTFSQLNRESLNISTNILSSVYVKNLPIGVYLPKSIRAITAFIGILYSGNIYMPLDIKNPKERIEGILNNIDPIAVITDEKNLQKLKETGYSGKILLLEDLTHYTKDIKTRYEEIIDYDGAYLLNTSGSTGLPKGVVISHRAVKNFIEWASDYFKVNENDVIGNQVPFYFDLSVFDIYITIKNGAKLIITPETFFSFPIKLLEYYKEQNVNMFLFVPSVLVNIANMDLLKTLRPDFNKILFCGEVMPAKQLNYWIKYYPDTLFCNLYGPTEATVACSYYTIDRKFEDNEPLPIGKACNNSEILIISDDNKLIIEPNISGELCVRGSALANGYYNNPKKTAEVFVQNPVNDKFPEYIYKTGDLVHYNEKGEIMFEGRKDFQIKHLGYRIELGEIETALGAVSEIKRGAIIYDSKNTKIVLFYESNVEIELKDLIKTLSNSIPKYMIPTEIYRLDKLPTNSNGKIDRNALSKLL